MLKIITLLTVGVFGLTSLWFATGGDYMEAAMWLAFTVVYTACTLHVFKETK